MCLDDCDGRHLTRRQMIVGSTAALVAACADRAAGPSPATQAPESTAASRAEASVVGSEVSFENGPTKVAALLFRPEAAPASPAVLVGDGNPGFAPWLRDLCERIAGQGLSVLYIDWMSRMPPFPSEAADQGAWRRQAGSAALWRAGASDFTAGLRWMRDGGVAHPKMAAAVGFCGGGVVLAHHAAQGAALRALVLFYANARISNSFQNPEDPLPDLVDIAGLIKVPVQAHYGAHDKTAKLDDARELEQRMVAAGRRPAFHYYADAGHGFMTAGEPLEADLTWGYVPAAAAAAEERMLGTLRASLR